MSGPNSPASIEALQQQLIEIRKRGDRVESRQDKRPAECEILGHLGVAYYQAQQWQEAISTLTEYLNLARELGNQRHEVVAQYYLGFAQQAAGENWPAVEAFYQAYRLFRQFGQEQFSSDVWQQLVQQGQRYFEQKQFVEAVQVYQLQIRVLLDFDDLKAANWIALELGKVYYCQGDFSKAIICYTGILEAAQTLKDQALESLALAWLGCSHRDSGEMEPAFTYFEQRLAVAQQLEDQAAQQETLGWLINISQQLEKYENTFQYYEIQSTFWKNLENHVNEYASLYDLAMLQFNCRQYQEALTNFERALQIAETLQDSQERIANTRFMLAQSCRNLGQQEAAISWYQQAVELYLELNIKNWAARGLEHLVNLYRELQNYEKEVECQKQRLKLAKQNEDRVAEQSLLYKIGNLYNNQKQDTQAIEYFQEALTLAETLEQRHDQANAHYMLGQSYSRLEQKEQAINFYQQAVTLYLELGVQNWALKGMEYLSDLYRNLKQYEQVLYYQQQRLKLAQDTQDKTAIQSSWYNLGCLYRDIPEDEQAIRALTQALTLAQELNQPYQAANAHYMLAQTYEKLERSLEAIEQYRHAERLYQETNTQKWAEKSSAKLWILEAKRTLVWGDSQSIAKNSHPQYLEFLEKLLNSDNDKKIVAPLLRANLDKLDENFLKIIQVFCDELEKVEPKPAQKIADAILDISDLIYDLPVEQRATNQEISIAIYERILKIFPSHTSQWAYTQHSLGIAYFQRIRGEEAENLEQGIAACNAALKVYSREDFPQYWAITQMTLGNAYVKRIRGEQADNLELALTHYNAALEVLTREAFPQYWAATQYSLGLVYWNRIGGEKVENVKMAITCYNAALEVYSQEVSPEAWAITQKNMGTAAYGERIREDKANNIERAISCYNSLLKVFNRQIFPEAWAITQKNMGTAYGERIREDKANNIERAISCYNAALEVFIQTEFPKDWASTQNSLANAYLDRIRGDKSENLEKALIAYKSALQILTCEAFPKDWANTQNNLGNAYLYRIRGDKFENLEKAIIAYEAALQIFTCEAFPKDWANTQNNLGNAYLYRIRGDKSENLERAIIAYDQALKVYTPEVFPYEWAKTQNNLGEAYRNRILGDKSENLEKAIIAYDLALKVYTPEVFPYEWARTQNNLGLAYLYRIQADKAEDLKKALIVYKAALQIFTYESFPYEWANTQSNLGIAYLANALLDGFREEKAENLERSIASFEAALQILSHKAFPQEHVRTLSNLGLTYQAKFRDCTTNYEQKQTSLQNAYITFTQAIDTVEYLRGEITSGDEAKRKLNEEWNRLYLRMVEVCLELDNDIAAIEYADRSKARNLVELIAIRDIYGADIREPDRQRLQYLRQEIYEENHRLAQNSNPDYTYITQLRQEFQAKFPYQPLEFKQIQSLLDQETGIFEWYILDNQFLTFILTPQTLHLWQSTSEDFKNLIIWVAAYLEDYRNNKTQWQNRLSQRLEALAQILHLDDILHSLFEKFPTCKKLILIPHRFLHLFPIHALPVHLPSPSEIEAKPLQEWFPNGVSYAPSCQLLQQAQNRQRPDFNQLFAIQNPTQDLDFTDIEVEAIQSYFNPHNVLKHDKAEKTALNLNNAHCTHFSCHGYFNFNDPLKSALLLANSEFLPPAPDDDQTRYIPLQNGNLLDLGKCLTLEDILRLDLRNCRLVTLSACETGITDFTSTSDEYIGLPSGFILAGSPNVVSSLWAVNDLSTALLMIRFYENLKNGETVPLALQHAQIWLRNATVEAIRNWSVNLPAHIHTEILENLESFNPHETRFASPDHWAAFCAIGK